MMFLHVYNINKWRCIMTTEKICTYCNSSARNEAIFCKTCGEKLINPLSESINSPRVLYCGQCGKPIIKDASFCKGCGCRLNVNVTPILNESQPTRANQPIQGNNFNRPRPNTDMQNGINWNEMLHSNNVTKEKSKKEKWPMFVGLSAVLVFVVVFGMLIGKFIWPVFFNHEPSNNNASVITQQTRPLEPEPIAMHQVAQGILSEDSLILRAEDENVSMIIPSICLSEEAEAEIIKLDATPPLEGVKINAYDFRIHTNETLSGVIRLEIPYEPDLIPDGKTVAESVGAVYYDVEKGYWVPDFYEIDEDRQVVIIRTERLSPHGSYTLYRGFGGEGEGGYISASIPRFTGYMEAKPNYGVFYTHNEGTVYESAYKYNLRMTKNQYSILNNQEALKELTQYGFSDANPMIINNTLNALSLLPSTLEHGSTLYNFTAYKTDGSMNFNTKMSNIGACLTLAILASDFYAGKSAEESLWNAFKGMVYWKGATTGKVLLSASAGPIIQVGLVGLFAYETVYGGIPSPIPKWKDMTVHERAFGVYDLYYHSGDRLNGNYRSNKEWKKIIEEINEKAFDPYNLDPNNTFDNRIDYFKAMLDQEIKSYAAEFWKLPQKELVERMATAIGGNWFGSYGRKYFMPDNNNRNSGHADEYVYEILSNYYSGMIKEMEEAYADDLVNRRLRPIIREIQEEIILKRERDLVNEMDGLQINLNQVIKIQIIDEGLGNKEKSRYEGYLIRPHSDDIDSRYEIQWQRELGKEGSAYMEFTVMSHLRAGGFDKFELYKPGDTPGVDEPELIVPFQITGLENIVYIKGEEDEVEVSILPPRNSTYVVKDGATEAEHFFKAYVEPEGTYRFEWDFKDGSPKETMVGKNASVRHTYTQIGTFYPEVSIYTVDGENIIATDSITIILEEDDNKQSPQHTDNETQPKGSYVTVSGSLYPPLERAANDIYLDFSIASVRNPETTETAHRYGSGLSVTGEVSTGDQIVFTASGNSSLQMASTSSNLNIGINVNAKDRNNSYAEKDVVDISVAGGVASSNMEIVVPEGTKSISGNLTITTWWSNINGWHSRDITVNYVFTVVD